MNELAYIVNWWCAGSMGDVPHSVLL